MPTVIVVISTYNGALHLKKQLDSIFAQQGVEITVLIRDDGSKDDTIKMIRNYQKCHPDRIIDMLQGENLGYAKSFWKALTLAKKADYYAFADQDDIWMPEKLIQCIQVMSADAKIPQLAYCDMLRCDEKLIPLEEQIESLTPENLTKKITLTKTYNYGAATVINASARELVCRAWPDIQDLPHDMWVGTLCFWFGKVYYVDKKLYYWIRYQTSVTGEGTRKTGIKYRIKKTFRKQSYVNITKDILENYGDLLEVSDCIFLQQVQRYKHHLVDRIRLVFDPTFRRTSLAGTLVLKFGILMGWF